MKNNVGRSTKVSWPIVVIIGVVLSGCTRFPTKPIPVQHVLMANTSGVAVDPTIEAIGPGLSQSQYDEYLRPMMTGIHEFCAAKKRGGDHCRILFFFHGGLNTRNASRMRAVALAPLIVAAGYYPIFVNWDSSLVSSYKDHVTSVYKGLKEPLLGFAAPVQVAMDEGSSIAEAPAAWFAELRHTFTGIELMSGGWKSAFNSYDALQTMHAQNPADSIDIGEDLRAGHRLRDDRSPGAKLRYNLALIPTLPTKVLAPPLAVQAFGRGAWDVMYRRTATLFTTEREFKINTEPKRGTVSAPPLLREFIARFKSEVLPDVCDHHDNGATGCAALEISLVGHSMGTIIMDQWLRNSPELELSNVVYMAGATSVSDYQGSMIIYLQRQRDRRSSGQGGAQKMPLTNVYHLVLHPVAEISETGVADLAPRGSLLVWIDNYFSRPVTPLDRTMGRFFNLMPELARTAPELRPQIHAKVFRVGASRSKTDPQIHGDFSDFPFWLPAFWKADVPLDQGPKRCRFDQNKESVFCPP
jgi:hypothetical protein